MAIRWVTEMAVDHGEDRPEVTEIGAIVGLRFANEVRPAEIVEDRGDLGPGGDRVVRLRIRLPPDDETEIEVPVSWLVRWPTTPVVPTGARTRRRRRDEGRRPAPA
jgi:hypothetical protein